MISFTLACDRGHEFESWFASGAAFEQQRKRRLVTCPMCGSAKVDKTVMAPAVARTDNRTRQGAVEAPSSPAPLAQPPGPQPHAVLGEPERQVRDMIRALRKHVAENSDYVGHKFPEEARQMHHGEIEHRSIWGEASAEEAKALAEEGVEVHPLPLLPDERN
jgi:hypothetical protein